MNFKKINFSVNECIEDSISSSLWNSAMDGVDGYVSDSASDSLVNFVETTIWKFVWWSVVGAGRISIQRKLDEF